MMYHSRLSFTSKRLMEVEVIVDIEVLLDQQLETKRVATAFICFLSLNTENRMMPVQPLKVNRMISFIGH